MSPALPVKGAWDWWPTFLTWLLAGHTAAGKTIPEYAKATIAADDLTPDVSAANVLVTSANTGATAITTLDNATAGQTYMLIGGSDTNSSTVADSATFQLAGAATFTLGDKDVLLLYANTVSEFLEISRSTN